MYFQFPCSNCGKNLKVSQENAGRRVRCPYCRKTMNVDAPEQKSESQVPQLKEPEPGAKPQQQPRPSPTRSEWTYGTDVNMLHGAVIGLVISVVFYIAVILPLKLMFEKLYFVELFVNRGWVPFALTFLIGWSAAFLYSKARKLTRQKDSMLFDLLPTEISDDITSDSLDKFVDHIQGLPARSRISFLTNRVLRGLEHFRVLNSSSEVAGRLASQSDIDANSVESSYTLIKVFIWAIPILGFIGTVIGISSAVGSFSQTLESAQNIEAMKESLNNVTGGLATAFDTTLVALVMSMLVMFPVTSMQKSEEDLLNWVDEYCNENFLKRLKDGDRTAMTGSTPSSTEEVRKAINEAMIVHHAELQTWSKKLESVGSTITKHVAKGMTELEIKQQERHDKRISELRKTASTMTVQHQDVVQKIDAAREHLAATQSELAAHYKSLSESAATAQDQVAGSMQQSAQALHGYFANLHQGLTALNALLEQLGQKQVVVQMQAAEPQQRGRGWFGKRK